VRPPPSDGVLRLLLVGAFAITACAAIAVVALAPGPTTGGPAVLWADWVLAGALLTLAATGWLFVRRSATAIAAAGAEIAPLQARLARKRATIEEFTNSQGRFVGNIAHEIKTPLTTVLSQTELLLGCSNDPAAVRHYAKSIADDMRHLSDLVESFLRLVRPLAQEDTSHHVPVYIHDVVVEAVRRSQTLALESGVSVVPTLAEPSNGDAALELLGDSVLLEAMVENLVRNAVRFSPRGSRVHLLVEVRGESIVLYVRDHGTGIPAEHLESVFDWFFQAPGVTLPSSGTGFGLAIARRVAEHHRGTITLRNLPAGGCEFEITLPRWRVDGPAGQQRFDVGAPPIARTAQT
jgi:two-component system OmpR family sensor kinase